MAGQKEMILVLAMGLMRLPVADILRLSNTVRGMQAARDGDVQYSIDGLW